MIVFMQDFMEEYLNYRGKGEIQVGVVTFSNVYGILGKTEKADETKKEE